jgi:gamma-glutamyltranspeptidase/glutathione hydrolase
VPPIGYVIRQPELAQTLELLAAQGQDGFYRGAFAHRLVEGVRGLGGNWSEQDLAAYQALERKPIVGTYHDARIVSASPPSSGGVALIEALHILEPYDLRALDAVTRKHLVIEAMRRAFRDRAQYLGDPDFVTVPVERLVSPFYADGQRTSIRLDRALPSSALAPVAGEVNSGPHTTHFSVLDAQGNRAAVTITLNLWFGSGLMVPGTGLLLNDEMDDFSVKAGIPNAYQLVGAEANSIAPGKRPLSSSTPTFVESPRGVMITGSPGGSYIISMAILATLDFLDGKTPQQIVSTPRYHHQYLPDVVLYEPDALDGAERAGLEQLGHTLRESNRRWGNMQVVTWDYASDKVQSASDPRGEGEGLVY